MSRPCTWTKPGAALGWQRAGAELLMPKDHDQPLSRVLRLAPGSVVPCRGRGPALENWDSAICLVPELLGYWRRVTWSYSHMSREHRGQFCLLRTQLLPVAGTDVTCVSWCWCSRCWLKALVTDAGGEHSFCPQVFHPPYHKAFARAARSASPIIPQISDLTWRFTFLWTPSLTLVQIYA